jgi:hypothetical protein
VNPEPETRASLLHRLKDLGDDKSWREFFLIYWKLIYTVAIRAGLTDAEAQDVVPGNRDWRGKKDAGVSL